MNKTSSNRQGNGKKKVLATKKASSGSSENKPLKFRQISEGELKAARNQAYVYMVK